MAKTCLTQPLPDDRHMMRKTGRQANRSGQRWLRGQIFALLMTESPDGMTGQAADRLMTALEYRPRNAARKMRIVASKAKQTLLVGSSPTLAPQRNN